MGVVMRFVLTANEIVSVRELLHQEAVRLGMFSDNFDINSLTYHEKRLMNLMRNMDTWFEDVMNRAFDATYDSM
jgi:hypothetical protein